MRLEEIMNDYALVNGYETFEELIFCTLDYTNRYNTIHHVKKVTDLIQDELKRKIVNEIGDPEYTYENSYNRILIGVYGDSDVTESVLDYKNKITEIDNII